MSAALERLAALAACTLVAVAVSRRLLQVDVFSSDAFVHQYWMWSFRDPALFTDPLTAELRGSARYPDGDELLFRLAAQVVSPIVFGEWLGVALMALSGWLVFLIVREHEPWRPASWIAAALFLALIDIHRFYGGFPRAFVHPVVLLCMLLCMLLVMRRRDAAAAAVAAGGALLYPTAVLLASGVLVVAAVVIRDRRRAAFAALALAGTVALVLLSGSGAPQVLTADEARRFPEFGAHGPLHYFVPSAIEYLRQNRSGFDLRAAGSVLMLAALALLLARRGSSRRLRVEVLALPAVALLGYAAAQAVLFRLYLPHRYTYPLVAFFAIVVGGLGGAGRAAGVRATGAPAAGRGRSRAGGGRSRCWPSRWWLRRRRVRVPARADRAAHGRRGARRRRRARRGGRRRVRAPPGRRGGRRRLRRAARRRRACRSGRLSSAS